MHATILIATTSIICVEVHSIFIIKQISRVEKHKSDSSIAQTNIKNRSLNSKKVGYLSTNCRHKLNPKQSRNSKNTLRSSRSRWSYSNWSWGTVYTIHFSHCMSFVIFISKPNKAVASRMAYVCINNNLSSFHWSAFARKKFQQHFSSIINSQIANKYWVIRCNVTSRIFPEC